MGWCERAARSLHNLLDRKAEQGKVDRDNKYTYKRRGFLLLVFFPAAELKSRGIEILKMNIINSMKAPYLVAFEKVSIHILEFKISYNDNLVG